MAVAKPVTKLQSCENAQFVVDDGILAMCPTAKHVVDGRRTSFRNALGGSTFFIQDNHVILKKEGRVLASLVKSDNLETVVSLPEVKTETLKRVIEYCEFFSAPEVASVKERRDWESQFIQTDMDQGKLCELASAAYYLDIKNLVNLTSKVIASQISALPLRDGALPASPSPERDALGSAIGGVPNDDVASFDSAGLSTRARLYKKLESKRRPLKDGAAPDTATPATDERSVDELLSFIEEDSVVKKSKKKKKTKNKTGNNVPSTSPSSTTPSSVTDATQRHVQQSSRLLPTGPAGADEPGAEQLLEPNSALSKAHSLLIDQRRELARAKLASTKEADVVWADSGDENNDTELDHEIQDFRLRLAQPHENNACPPTADTLS